MADFSNRRPWLWGLWVVVALLLLDVLDQTLYRVIVPLSALAVALLPGMLPATKRLIDRTDLLVIAALYVGVVGLFWLAFGYFTVDRVLGLFLSFAAGMLLGVIGALGYTARRGQPLKTLGIRLDNWRQTAAWALIFAAVQFLLTLYGYPLPAPVNWVPLLVMALTVGMFEAVFFRGFIQTRLEASFGPVLGMGAAAALYALYHVGYGMGPGEMVFLFGLGVVYAVAFSLVRNLLVLWPLLTPLGSFFANLSASDISLPWASIAGFVDVFAVMVAVAIILLRRQRRRVRPRPRPALRSG
jgi:membrane protease YdiL (CAAX protease family)